MEKPEVLAGRPWCRPALRIVEVACVNRWSPVDGPPFKEKVQVQAEEMFRSSNWKNGNWIDQLRSDGQNKFSADRHPLFFVIAMVELDL